MMVPSRCVKSEYMKRFKEPKWEACGPCYQELLRYRLSRRLLEQAHRPWFWDGWEKDHNLINGGGGSGYSSSLGTSNSLVAQPQEEEAAGGFAAGMEGPSSELSPWRLSAPGEEEFFSAAEAARRPEEDDQEKYEGKAEVQKDRSKSAAGKEIISSTSYQPKQPLSQTNASGCQRQRKSAKSPQRTETALGTKHPFALYGWGEKQTDTGSQKTHNVCASASVNEIHESALRAKNRRQMEKRKLSQKRIHPIEAVRTWRAKSSGPDNPWMTEYMRCYSARTR